MGLDDNRRGKQMASTTIEYGHWGITVATRNSPHDYAPVETKHFGYPVGTRGPVDSADTERAAIAYCRSLGGEVKGPFFYRDKAGE